MKKARKRGGFDLSKKYVCIDCGCQRDPISVKRGLLVIEICMWLLYIFPGVIYSIWRRVRKQQVCQKCQNPSVVLTSSTRAMEMRRLMGAFPQTSMTNSKNPQPVTSSTSVPAKQNPTQKPKTAKKDLNQILKSTNRRGLKPKGQQGLIDFKSPDKNQ